MKTHVIHLAAHDDYHSARDQMTWAKSGRILLVYPKKGRVLENQLDLILLQRQAADLGAQLALVTDDEIVTDHANELGIPVFETIKQAQRQTWRTSGKNRSLAIQQHQKIKRNLAAAARVHQKEKDFQNTWIRVGIFSVGVISILFLLLFLFNSAEIRIYPEKITQSMEFDLKADPNIKQSTLSGIVPAKVISLSVEKTSTRKSTGAVEVSDQPATGELTLTNLTETPITVPEGTIFMTLGNPPVRYKSTRAVKLENIIGAHSVVPIEALLAGENGNTPAGTIQGVEGAIGLSATASNKSALGNGSNRESPSPSMVDYQELSNENLASLREKALVELQQKAGKDGVIVPGSLKMERIVQEKKDPAEGIPSDTANLNVEAVFSAQIANEKDIKETARLILDSNLPIGFHAKDDEIQLEKVSSTGKPVSWRVKADRILEADWNRDAIAQIAAGKSVKQAIKQLSEVYRFSQKPEIKIKPMIFGFLPFLAYRIDITEAK
jgi:hypothetical protein